MFDQNNILQSGLSFITRKTLGCLQMMYLFLDDDYSYLSQFRQKTIIVKKWKIQCLKEMVESQE